MLGALDTETRDTETLLQIKALAESILYTAPELREQRRIEILTQINRILREWEKA
jgi:hypothetical protein